MKPLLNLMQAFNRLLGRHAAIPLPYQIFRIELNEGFTLKLDGQQRRLTEGKPDNPYCTITTTIPHLETLLKNPNPGTVMPLIMTGKISVDDKMRAVGLAMSLNKICELDRTVPADAS